MRMVRVRPAGLLLGSLLVTVVGCNVGPKYVRPQAAVPPAFRGADEAQVSSEPAGSLGDQQWAQVFHQPELQALIKTALANNYDLRIAAERVLEQQAQVRITRAQQFPQITVGGTGVGATFPNIGGSNSGSTSSSGNNSGITSPIEFGSYNLSASWTPDFWGLYRKQTQAAREQLLAQVWAQRAVRLTLVQNVATTYFTLRQLDAQLAIAKRTLATRQQSVDLTRKLETGGASPL